MALMMGCIKKELNDLEIGKPLSKEVHVIRTQIVQSNSNGSFGFGKLVEKNGISYEVYEDSGNLVRYIRTDDSLFKIKDFTIGTSFRQLIKDSYEVKDGEFLHGFNYSVPISGGWHAVFSDSLIIYERKVSDSSKIRYFFRNK